MKREFNGCSMMLWIAFIFFQTTAIAQNVESQVDTYIGAYMKIDNFSGSILIAKDDRILYKKSFGMANYEHDVPNTPQTKFQIGSMAKSFTAMAIMILQEKGLLRVEDPLSNFVTDFPNGKKITIYHLLTHTAGVPALEDIPNYMILTKIKTPLEETIEKLKKQSPVFEPGTDYQYSNSGYMLLGYIIEKVSGQSYGAFLKENIFDPLEMKNTGFDDPITLVKHRAGGYAPGGELGFENADYFDLTSVRGAGTLYSTVEDLYRWDRALYTEKLVTKSTMNKIFTPPTGRRYAYGWVITERFGHKMICHDGNSSGFQAFIARFVDDDACLIVLSNFIHAPIVKIRNDLTAILFGKAYEMPEPMTIIQIDPDIYDAYEGQYAMAHGDTITVTREGDRLFAETLAFPARFEIFPVSETKFLVKIRENTAMSFIKNEKDLVDDFILHFSGQDIPGKRVK